MKEELGPLTPELILAVSAVAGLLATRVASGDLSARINDTTGDEIGASASVRATNG